MDPATPTPGAEAAEPAPLGYGPFGPLVRAIRTRIVSGLILALPIVLTFWILYWLYATFQGIILEPMTNLYRRVFENEPSVVWEQFGAPLVAIVLILGFLYLLGLLVHSSLHRAVDTTLRRLPVVTTLYNALSNVAQSLGDQVQRGQFQRVVLVEFPHPGMRSLAFVTKSLHDTQNGRTILCVCVLTGVVPPAGFTLFVPEESVTDLDWTVNQALQAIVSGGISAPTAIGYFGSPADGASRSPAARREAAGM
jgi:uncharacterized membrane protein